MTLRITDEVMVSDLTAHAAAVAPGVGWVVSWLPGRSLDRNQAVAALLLAEAVAEMQTDGLRQVVDHTHRLWPRIDAWAAELGLTGPDAVVRVSERPGADQSETDPAALRSLPGAGVATVTQCGIDAESVSPMTFTEAREMSPYDLAQLWADWPRRRPLGGDAPEAEVSAVAVMSALANWLTRWRAGHVHRALLAGVDVGQLAEALGGTPGDVARVWQQWAEGQRELRRRYGKFGLTDSEYGQVAEVLERSAAVQGGELP